MGYCIQLLDSKFEIKKEHFKKLKKAFKKLDENHKLAWVEKGFSHDTLSNVFDSLRYPVQFSQDESNNECISSIEFSGEKLGNDDFIWDTIAPFVTSGSYLEFLGEEGEMWRVIFKDGKWEEKSPQINWD